jgi:hypothetical protein
METKKNESAFPIIAEDYIIDGGLTKREYFAGLAMQGLLGVIDDGDTPSVVAKSAVMTADALIDELNK